MGVLLSKTEYKQHDTIFKAADMTYSEYLEFVQLQEDFQNVDEFVVWQTGMDADSDEEDEEKESSGPCGACLALEGQIFHISSVPSPPHDNCKCGTIPLRFHIEFERISERLKELEEKSNKADKISNDKKQKLISSYYGQKDGPHPKGHTGTDFRTPIGTAIKSPVNGVVSRNNYSKGNGNRVAIIDKNGVEHHFYHMNEPSNLPIGSDVSKGDIVGNSGNTGRSTGPHVHYEVRDTNGNTLDEQRIAPSEENIDYLIDSFYDSMY